MKYKTQSANVLNEADRFEQILNVTLFTHEQNERLWGYNPKVSWKPGDPIFIDPRQIDDFGPHVWYDELGFPHADVELNRNDPDTWCGGLGNYVRPMYQLIDDERRWPYVRCVPCGVSWAPYSDHTCWNCGESRPPFGYRPIKFFRPEIQDVEYVSHHSFEVVGHIQDVESTPQGFRATMTFVDEGFSEMYRQMMRHLDLEWGAALVSMRESMEAFSAPVHRAISSIGRRHGRSAVDSWIATESWWRTASTPVVVHGVELPADWATMRQEIPMPEIPEPPDYSSLGVQERPGSSSISRRRRERGNG